MRDEEKNIKIQIKKNKLTKGYLESLRDAKIEEIKEKKNTKILRKLKN